MSEQSEWRQHIVDVLEVANAKHQATCTEFVAIYHTIEYMAEAIYHHFVGGSEVSTEE